MNLVTGATGLLGSHLAEKLVQRGRPVRALVRATSNTAFLRSLGVELAPGDLTDPESLRRALRGVTVVYHAAAKVGDWGPWRDFQAYTIDGTRNILDACSSAGVERLIHVSSISAYGHPAARPEPITEDEPLGQNLWIWDYYTRAKVAAERLVWDHHHRTGLPVTVIRPSWLYGPRDRTSTGRLVEALANRRMWIIGRGNNRLNLAYAGNVADGALLAADSPAAVGQAYNLSNDGSITQAEYLNSIAAELRVRPVRRRLPFRLAFVGAFGLEAWGRLIRRSRPPLLSRYAAWLMGRSSFYSTQKARDQLGWRSHVSYPDGIRLTVAWYLNQTKTQKGEPERQEKERQYSAA